MSGHRGEARLPRESLVVLLRTNYEYPQPVFAEFAEHSPPPTVTFLDEVDALLPGQQ